MLQIECPWCGVRDESEFVFGGEAHIARPAVPASAGDGEWADYLFNRTNPKSIHYERWQHRHGCRQWFNVARDTVSHEIHLIYKVSEPRPALKGPPA